MSSCHQSCTTCDGQDDASCTSCNSTSFLAVQGNDRGYCISCSTEVPVHGYAGIRGCSRCMLPSSTDTAPVCLDCSEYDYMVSINGRSCVASCGIGASSNYYTRQCTCIAGYGLDQGNRAQGCILCKVSSCALCTDNADICNACEIPFGLSLDGRNCLEVGGCPANCVCENNGTDSGATCVLCEKRYFLQPARRICLHSCPIGYAANPITNTCDLCPANCYSCERAIEDQCTSCVDGYFIYRTDSNVLTMGRCVPECAEAAVGPCVECHAILGSARYCSRCSQGFFPLDGRCVSTSGQQISACAQTDKGLCLKCALGYFLHQGGCYSSLYAPGKLVCAAAERIDPAAYGTCRACTCGYHRTSDGGCIKCTMTGCFACPSSPDICTFCSNGYYSTQVSVDSEEVHCSQCAPGCLSCEDSSPSGCNLCAPGYFWTSSVHGCIRCDNSTISGPLKGVKGCKQCLVSSSETSVVCLDNDPDSPFAFPPLSTNRTTLILSITLPLAVLLLAATVITLAIILVKKRKTTKHGLSTNPVTLTTMVST